MKRSITVKRLAEIFKMGSNLESAAMGDDHKAERLSKENLITNVNAILKEAFGQSLTAQEAFDHFEIRIEDFEELSRQRDTGAIYYTTAPEDYDGFGTETIEWTELQSTNGLRFRMVSILPESVTWQTMRYASGNHAPFTPEQWKECKDLFKPFVHLKTAHCGYCRIGLNVTFEPQADEYYFCSPACENRFEELVTIIDKASESGQILNIAYSRGQAKTPVLSYRVKMILNGRQENSGTRVVEVVRWTEDDDEKMPLDLKGVDFVSAEVEGKKRGLWRRANS